MATAPIQTTPHFILLNAKIKLQILNCKIIFSPPIFHFALPPAIASGSGQWLAGCIFHFELAKP